MDPAEGQPTVDVVERDGQIGGMGGDVCSNSLPADDTIFSTEMVVVGDRNGFRRWVRVHFLVGEFQITAR